ncbi:MAG: diacylglycerol kinase family protein [Pirellulales bacterium]|nr:diacylglycerol kinase family protein [Pirellulales bacterium]
MLQRITRLSDKTHVLIACNPKSGQGPNLALIQKLQSLLIDVGYTVLVTTDLEVLLRQAADWQAQDLLRAVIAAGGDGTLNLLVNRLTEGVPLLVLPLGTENLLAKYLGITVDPATIVRILRQGWTYAFDAGRAGDRLFLLMFSCGLDADVVHRLHAVRKGPISHLSYIPPLWEALQKYNYPEFGIRWDFSGSREAEKSQTTSALQARWAFISNLPCYAGQLRVAPLAVGDDGLLDLCAFQGGTFLHSLKYLSGVFFGLHHRMPDCRVAQFRRVLLESDIPVPFQVDGDPGGTLPVRIEVVPGRFLALVPGEWLEKERKW